VNPGNRMRKDISGDAATLNLALAALPFN